MVKKISNKKRSIILILIVVFILVIVSCILFLWYTFSGNYITYGFYDDSANNATAIEATNSNVIIANGIVLGANNSNKWVSADKYYEANSSKNEIKVDVFSENRMYGTYKTASIKKYASSVIYTTIDKDNLPSKYLALATSDKARIMPGMTKLEATKQDVSYVKQALGSYKLINGSIKITEVYGTSIKQASDKIICVIAEKSNLLGVYSAVVYVTEEKATLIKYAYVRDTKDSDRWPIYSLKFVMDINMDSVPELILEETTGNDVSYSVLEFKNNKFYEVLKSTLKIQ